MKTIIIPEGEAYNEKLNKFITVPSVTLKLEHSLLSLQKWESKHHKYFIDNKDLTEEEILDYIRCMTINSDVDPNAYDYLTKENIKEIVNYMEDPMTATWFREDPLDNRPKKKEILTAEVIYASMINLGIPIDIFEKRHLNHLITLIRVCGEMQNPDKDKKKKVNTKELAMKYSEINKARKAKLGTKG